MGLIMMLSLACLAHAASNAQAAPSFYEQSHGVHNLGKAFLVKIKYGSCKIHALYTKKSFYINFKLSNMQILDDKSS